MNYISKEGLEWFSMFLPSSTDVQKNIFSKWIKNLSDHYDDILKNIDGIYSSEKQKKILLSKVFHYFFPYTFITFSPFELPDLEKSVEILKDAFYHKDDLNILLYGDRDVDGITSLAILYLFLRDEMKYPEENLHAMVPREEDKYGITIEVAERILKKNPNILITLDCGSSNKEALDYMKNKQNMKIIVIDHHFIPEKESDFPKVEAFVNPKRLGPLNTNRDLCTAGIAYKLIWGLLYSFTSEYDIVNKVVSENQVVYIQKGVLVDQSKYDESAKKRQVLLKASESKISEQKNEEVISALPLWERETNRNPLFHKLDRFLKLFPDSVVLEDQARFLLNVQLKNIESKSRPFLPLAALGTIADIMPLIDDNRILVSEGLNVLTRNSASIPNGLRGILQVSNLLKKRVTEQDIAFSLSPMINAAGRLGQAHVALDALIEKDKLEGLKKAYLLKNLNEERKRTSKKGLDNVLPIVEPTALKKPMIIVFHEEVHRGISGLVANKLADLFKKPAMVLVNDGDSIRGSIRAYQNENVYAFILELKDFFIQFGGHKQAAGFSMENKYLDEFIQKAEDVSKEKNHIFDTDRDADLDENRDMIHLNDNELSPSLWEECKMFAPFGKLNPCPLFAINSTDGFEVDLMGKDKDHARVNLKAVKDKSIELVWFFHNGDAKNLLNDPEKKGSFTFYGEPHLSSFNGRIGYQLKIKKCVSN